MIIMILDSEFTHVEVLKYELEIKLVKTFEIMLDMIK